MNIVDRCFKELVDNGFERVDEASVRYGHFQLKSRPCVLAVVHSDDNAVSIKTGSFKIPYSDIIVTSEVDDIWYSFYLTDENGYIVDTSKSFLDVPWVGYGVYKRNCESILAEEDRLIPCNYLTVKPVCTNSYEELRPIAETKWWRPLMVNLFETFRNLNNYVKLMYSANKLLCSSFHIFIVKRNGKIFVELSPGWNDAWAYPGDTYANFNQKYIVNLGELGKYEPVLMGTDNFQKCLDNMLITDWDYFSNRYFKDIDLFDEWMWEKLWFVDCDLPSYKNKIISLSDLLKCRFVNVDEFKSTYKRDYFTGSQQINSIGYIVKVFREKLGINL